MKFPRPTRPLANEEPSNPERHVAEEGSEGHAPVSLAGQSRSAMRAISETLSHRRRLRADHFGLDSRRNALSLVQRQAERLRNSAGLPLLTSQSPTQRQNRPQASPATPASAQLRLPAKEPELSLQNLQAPPLCMLSAQIHVACSANVRPSKNPSIFPAHPALSRAMPLAARPPAPPLSSARPYLKDSRSI